jgi:Fe2+ transport system protein FeoA
VRNPERSTWKYTLATIPRSLAARVVAVGDDHAATLAAHGLHPGRLVRVLADAPFGGPRVVEVGAARLAVARRVAMTVTVAPEPDAVAAAPP